MLDNAHIDRSARGCFPSEPLEVGAQPKGHLPRARHWHAGPSRKRSNGRRCRPRACAGGHRSRSRGCRQRQRRGVHAIGRSGCQLGSHYITRFQCGIVAGRPRRNHANRSRGGRRALYWRGLLGRMHERHELSCVCQVQGGYLHAHGEEEELSWDLDEGGVNLLSSNGGVGLHAPARLERSVRFKRLDAICRQLRNLRGLRPTGALTAILLSLSPTGVRTAAASDALAIPAQDVPEFRLSAMPLLEIGREGNPAFQFTSITSVRLFDDGRVVVSDAGAREIRVFASDGAHLITLGGPGDGPGEFQSLDGLWTIEQTVIRAWDAESQRITTFSADPLDASVQTQRVHTPVNSGLRNPPQAFLGAFPNGDAVLASLAFGGSPGPGPIPVADRWFLGRFGPDGTFRELLGELRGMRRLRGFPLPFSPLPRVALAGDSVFVADGYEARISLLVPERVPSPGDFVFPSRVETPSVGEVWESLEAALEAEGGSLFLERMDDMPRPEAFPEVGGMLPAEESTGRPNGILWMQRYNPFVDSVWLGDVLLRPSAGGEWILFDGDGTVTAILRVPDTFIPMHIAGDRLAGIVIDLLGVERVAVYSLESDAGHFEASNSDFLNRW